MAILKKKDIPPMKPEVKEKVSAAIKKHYFFLLIFRLGRTLANIGIRGFYPIYTDETNPIKDEEMRTFISTPRIVVTIVIRALILFIAFFKAWEVRDQFLVSLLLTVVNYAVLHALFLIPGIVLRNVGEGLLMGLQKNLQTYKKQYETDLLAEQGFENNEIQYDDGIAICLNDISIETVFKDTEKAEKEFEYHSVLSSLAEDEPEETPVSTSNQPAFFREEIPATSATLKIPAVYFEDDITIFCMNQPKGFQAFSNREIQSYDLVVEKGISSLDFRDRFSVVVHNMAELRSGLANAAERKAIQMFPATAQMEMTKNKLYEKTSTIRISQGMAVAETIYEIHKPTDLNLYRIKSLLSYFKEVDAYCKKVQDMCTFLHSGATQTWFSLK